LTFLEKLQFWELCSRSNSSRFYVDNSISFERAMRIEPTTFSLGRRCLYARNQKLPR